MKKSIKHVLKTMETYTKYMIPVLIIKWTFQVLLDKVQNRGEGGCTHIIGPRDRPWPPGKQNIGYFVTLCW